MNPATGNGGTCYGDSGGPNFLGATRDDHRRHDDHRRQRCRSTNVDYRLDTVRAGRSSGSSSRFRRMSWSLKGTVIDRRCNSRLRLPVQLQRAPDGRASARAAGCGSWTRRLRRRAARRACALRLRQLARSDPRGRRSRESPSSTRTRDEEQRASFDEARARRGRRPVGDLHRHRSALRRPAARSALFVELSGAHDRS